MAALGTPQLPRPRVQAQKKASKATNIEDQVRYSYFVPAPGTYDPTYGGTPSDPKPLGKISDYKAPSVLDHAARTQAYVPGPGSYHTPDTGSFALPEGGRLNRNPPVERFKLDEYPKPPPGHYGIPQDPSRPRMRSGKFSTERREAKFIADEVTRSAQVPAPGTHDVMEAQEAIKPFVPEGGRCLMAAKPKSYFEVAPKLSECNPDPGSYNLPSAIERKPAGRLVYRYESATIEDTRHIITRTVGEKEAVPGPGHYTLPDPPPTLAAPTMKSKIFGHGMPHPFAYNCTPDYARNFITPVRQQNSSDQIFGTGVKRGALAAASAKSPGGRGSRPSSAGRGDQVQQRDMPESVGLYDAEMGENTVQWRSGGFTSLKKSRSTGMIRAEHASVEEMKKAYPQLAHRNRERSTFLPMASRRSESVSTHENSEEYQRLCHGKWHLKAVAEGIKSATAAALEPLDEERLRQQAMEGLRDKARERMRLEGVSKDQQDSVLAEMSTVLEERSRAKLQPTEQADDPPVEVS